MPFEAGIQSVLEASVAYVTIVANGQDATSGIYGYAYSIYGVNYSKITSNNIYTVS